VAATQVAVARPRDAVRPGLSENELWSVMHQGVIALGGHYLETRLPPSGERTRTELLSTFPFEPALSSAIRSESARFERFAEGDRPRLCARSGGRA